jgi:hypothetical protein
MDGGMWRQLLDSNPTNKVGPDATLEPSESFVEPERKHAEQLAQLAKLRAARLAQVKSKGRRRA